MTYRKAGDAIGIGKIFGKLNAPKAIGVEPFLSPIPRDGSVGYAPPLLIYYVDFLCVECARQENKQDYSV